MTDNQIEGRVESRWKNKAAIPAQEPGLDLMVHASPKESIDYFMILN